MNFGVCLLEHGWPQLHHGPDALAGPSPVRFYPTKIGRLRTPSLSSPLEPLAFSMLQGQAQFWLCITPGCLIAGFSSPHASLSLSQERAGTHTHIPSPHTQRLAEPKIYPPSSYA